ncbi:GGDEF family protein [Shewanella sediminis HAW-EB3]|uniref:diguanylate cyclase n=1 Tax=Shewanella sediminis (strain HAW-EB3) TaxID=425104 RepID=A8FSZ2_SHESH|nr:GGDEF domain-containing protein [Shewanella sediminis]ABV35965.1 GGDEF family protein [Shewanella sediminis HAW-EB3]
MDSFQWDGHFVTGLDDVDRQHHQLVNLINRFGHLLASNNLQSCDIDQVLSELWRYTQHHFQDEEALMQAKGVDERHVKLQEEAHNYFLSEMQAIQASTSIGNPETLKYLLDFLTQWLAYHILGADQNMARQIAAIDSGLTPEQAYAREESQADSATAPLLKALNGLFKQVSQRNKQLIEFNHSLEEKVQQRTQELIDANAHLEKLSVTDVLTGLPNRRFAMEKLTQLWQESVQSQQPLACMMLDADHFKTVNDTYGHDAGDRVLCELSRELQHAVRTDDIVCRLGGDEFVIICPATDLNGIRHIATQVHEKIAAMTVSFGSGSWQGSISVGVSSRTDQMQDYSELIKRADEAVYLAKQAGKNCVRRAQ